MANNQLFLIKRGKALELIKAHISRENKALKAARKIGGELGASRIYTDLITGVLLGVDFDGNVPPDFAKPKRGSDGISFPKKNSSWAKRFNEQKGNRNPALDISSAFEIPLSISYTTNDGDTGNALIGSRLAECGFLYLDKGGPYAMWVPDVPAYVSEMEKNGCKVSSQAKTFKMKFEGCRRIEDEEWDILAAKHKLGLKKRAKTVA